MTHTEVDGFAHLMVESKRRPLSRLQERALQRLRLKAALVSARKSCAAAHLKEGESFWVSQN
jgi:hypothetical protein